MARHVIRVNPSTPRRRRTRTVVRVNPTEHAIRADQLRPGDTIEAWGIGREHVIKGPFRSARGVRFIGVKGDSYILGPGEPVLLVDRENPRRRRNPQIREADSRLVELQQRTAEQLNDAGLLGKGVRFRETRRGELEVRNVDSYHVAKDHHLTAELRRIAEAEGFELSVGAGYILMSPFSHFDTLESFHNPTRRRRRR